MSSLFDLARTINEGLHSETLSDFLFLYQLGNLPFNPVFFRSMRFSVTYEGRDPRVNALLLAVPPDFRGFSSAPPFLALFSPRLRPHLGYGAETCFTLPSAHPS